MKNRFFLLSIVWAVVGLGVNTGYGYGGTQAEYRDAQTGYRDTQTDYNDTRRVTLSAVNEPMNTWADQTVERQQAHTKFLEKVIVTQLASQAYTASLQTVMASEVSKLIKYPISQGGADPVYSEGGNDYGNPGAIDTNYYMGNTQSTAPGVSQAKKSFDAASKAQHADYAELQTLLHAVLTKKSTATSSQERINADDVYTMAAATQFVALFHALAAEYVSETMPDTASKCTMTTLLQGDHLINVAHHYGTEKIDTTEGSKESMFSSEKSSTVGSKSSAIAKSAMQSFLSQLHCLSSQDVLTIDRAFFVAFDTVKNIVWASQPDYANGILANLGGMYAPVAVNIYDRLHGKGSTLYARTWLLTYQKNSGNMAALGGGAELTDTQKIWATKLPKWMWLWDPNTMSLREVSIVGGLGDMTPMPAIKYVYDASPKTRMNIPRDHAQAILCTKNPVYYGTKGDGVATPMAFSKFLLLSLHPVLQGTGECSLWDTARVGTGCRKNLCDADESLLAHLDFERWILPDLFDDRTGLSGGAFCDSEQTCPRMNDNTSTTRAGAVNAGLLFDGNDVAMLGDVPVSKTFTISLWAKHQSGDLRQNFVSKYDAAGKPQFQLATKSGKIELVIGGETYSLPGKNGGYWYHYAVSVRPKQGSSSGSEINIWINGAQHKHLYVDDTITIGNGSLWTLGESLVGGMDEIRFTDTFSHGMNNDIYYDAPMVHFTMDAYGGKKGVKPQMLNEAAPQYVATCGGAQKCPEVVSAGDNGNKVLSFDGYDDYLNIHYATDPDENSSMPNPLLYDNGLSIEMWVNPSHTDNGQTFVGKTDKNGKTSFWLGYWDDVLWLSFSNQHIKIPGGRAGGWQQLGVVMHEYKAGNDDKVWIKVIRNGQGLVEQGVFGRLHEVLNQGRAWTIGQHWEGSWQTKYHYEGLMDDVRFYGHWRDAGSYSSHYNDQSKVYAASTVEQPTLQSSVREYALDLVSNLMSTEACAGDPAAISCGSCANTICYYCYHQPKSLACTKNPCVDSCTGGSSSVGDSTCSEAKAAFKIGSSGGYMNWNSKSLMTGWGGDPVEVECWVRKAAATKGHFYNMMSAIAGGSGYSSAAMKKAIAGLKGKYAALEALGDTMSDAFVSEGAKYFLEAVYSLTKRLKIKSDLSFTQHEIETASAHALSILNNAKACDAYAILSRHGEGALDFLKDGVSMQYFDFFGQKRVCYNPRVLNKMWSKGAAYAGAREAASIFIRDLLLFKLGSLDTVPMGKLPNGQVLKSGVDSAVDTYIHNARAAYKGVYILPSFEEGSDKGDEGFYYVSDKECEKIAEAKAEILKEEMEKKK